MYREVIQAFYQNRNDDQAMKMAAYMKNKFLYLGIQKPMRTALQKVFLKQAKKAAQIDWNFVFMLWELPEREFQYFAVDYLFELKNSLQKDDIENLERLIIHKPWWDTIDAIAGTLVGVLCSQYPSLIESHMLKWAECEDIWLVRVAILFQLKYKEKTNTKVLRQIILSNSHTKEFFINKAIGWILREYSKTDKDWVKDFIGMNSLHPLSVREGSKYFTIS